METQQLNKDEIRAMGEKLGSGIKTEEELGELTKTLRKAILEAALSAGFQFLMGIVHFFDAAVIAR